MASQRLRGASAGADASGFKYKGIKDENVRPHEQCEMENDDTHEVHPTTWPPPRIGTQGGDPSVSLRCVHCGAWLVVYQGHATGEMQGIRVVLPESAPVEERRGPGRPRKQLV
jgi:hypothetical protein